VRFGEIGQLVDHEDAAMSARQEPEVDGQLVRQVAAFGNLDGIDLADRFSDISVGSVGGG
jgi:hypothetical protein